MAGDQATATASPALRGTIEVPADKSMSHRALILGALAKGTTSISGLLEGQDVLDTAAAVRAFGATAERCAPGEWRVTGGAWRSPPTAIDCGNSGTGVRLLMGAAAGFDLEAVFTGDRSLTRRPMDRVLAPLRTMGAEVEASEGGRLPVRLRGGRLCGIHFRNDKASAQIKSAILLAGLRSEAAVEVLEPAPSRDHSENMLRAFGCDVEVEETADGRLVRLGRQRSLTAATLQIPGDPSSAAFPLVAALISPGSNLTVRSVMVNPLRAGLFTTLAEMGADLRFLDQRSMSGEAVADIAVRSSPLRGVEVPAERAPSMIDEYPILAIAAAFARGRTVMHGIGELRVKESDRLAAILAGLAACGIEAWEEGDTLIVDGLGGPPVGGAKVLAHDDHRIAMSFLVMGLASERAISVDSANMIDTSFPGFARTMGSIGARIA
ncbi:3-phosphoshikimate 1-carboxyvinyltransferase [Sphingosinicella humi]|uniref:3-phosphoshikimate 1-carboxyvinyltransferase n=1 Tax=Allosphingosinicella humi TaxID=2068657 RepID=A0A2U2J4L3_9SPHN|nr:3-phosphoshikimate 1-carboxyvinyltransferase [Sphingosinicella humi]PWG03221.1 3-phosphoshikimate 1-carboxyvinyltransferase [Sphingosinicella humi]